MFYSQVILARKGPLGKIWLAAHWDKKLTKQNIFSCDITESVDNILNPTAPLALRVSGHLMLGVVRIYSRKVKYLIADCADAMWKIKLAFRPGNVDLPEAATTAAAAATDDPRFFGYIEQDYDFPELAETAFSQDVLTQYDELRAARGRHVSSEHDTTLDSLGFRGLDPYGDDFETGSRISDIEVMRHEQRRSRGSMLSEVGADRGRLSLSTAGGVSLSGKRQDEHDEIPAFDDQDYFEPPALVDFDQEPAPYKNGFEMDVMSPPVRLSAVISPDKSSPGDVDQSVAPGRTSNAVVSDEDAPVEGRKRKRRVKPAAQIDTRLELSKKEIKQFLQDTSPTLRTSTDTFAAKRIGIRFASNAAEAALGKGSLTAEDRLYHPYARGLCPQLQQLFTSALSRRHFDPSTMLGTPPAEDVVIHIPKRHRIGDESQDIDIEVARYGDVGFDEYGQPRVSVLSGISGSRASPSPSKDGYGFDVAGGQDFPEFYDSEIGVNYEVARESSGLEPPMSPVNIEGEEELERLSEAELQVLAAGASSENWSTRTNDVLEILKSEFETKDKLHFKDMCDGCTRRTAAASFMELLQLKTWGLLELNQSSPFAGIDIMPTDKLANIVSA